MEWKPGSDRSLQDDPGKTRQTPTGLAEAGASLTVDYPALEARARLTDQETSAPDGLLPAVAAVVAEVILPPEGRVNPVRSPAHS